jgi:protein arginine N-methyltransferase 1
MGRESGDALHGEYWLASYGDMLTDRVRMGAYLEAMRRYITPDTVVLDIGTVPGVTALLAAQCGARHVYAIEANSTVWLGKRLAQANGLQDRITFYHGLSMECEIPERADLLISDLRGSSPLFGLHIPTIIDARARLLKPQAIQVPLRDRLVVGLARDDHQAEKLRRPWLYNDFGLDLSICYRHVVNQVLRAHPKTTVSYGQGKLWAELDYCKVSTPDARGEVSFDVDEAIVMNGLELWFETDLAPGISFGTGPAAPRQVYGREFLPLSEDIALQPGDRVVVWLDYRLLDVNYRVSWKVLVLDQAGVARAEFQHSTFLGSILNPEVVSMFASGHLSGPNPQHA